jgi:hypothetical protein
VRGSVRSESVTRRESSLCTFTLQIGEYAAHRLAKTPGAEMSWRFQLSKGTAADPRCEGRYRLRGFSRYCEDP